MRLNLRVKLTFIFLLIFMTVFTVTGIIVYQRSKETIKDSVFKQLHCRIKGIHGRLDSFCYEREINIRSKATSMYIRKRLNEINDSRNPDVLIKEIVIRLRQMMASDPRMMELFILDIKGNVVASTDETQIGLNKSDRTYFLEGSDFVTGTTSIYYSPVFNQPTMLSFTPIIQLHTAKFLGIAVERMNFEHLSAAIMQECALLEGEEVYALDGGGRFVFGSMGESFHPDKVLNSDFIKGCLEGKPGDSRYKNYRGTAVIGKCCWLADRQCALIVELSEEEAFKPICKIRNLFLIVGIASSLIIVCLVVIVARHMFLPIMRLKEAADKVASGNLKIKVDVDTKDEIEFLANSFNKMVNDLSQSRKKLKEWGETSEKEVERKTKELEEKIEELEKFNKVTVDRELKMITLKKEIENLKKKMEKDRNGRQFTNGN